MSQDVSLVLQVIGDFITDVVFAADSRMPLPRGKETAFPGAEADTSVVSGSGGVSYLQQLVRVLLESDSSVKIRDTKEPKAARYVNYWTVAKRRRDLSPTSGSTYRTVERIGQNFLGEDSETSGFPRIDETECPDLLLLADHDRYIRRCPEWLLSEYKLWLTAESKTHWPNRIISLANRLPARFTGRIPPKGGEPLWDILVEETSPAAKDSTVIVTSVDRLRQEGANISKRVSWDATLLNFQHELRSFDPLIALSQFGHLVVRIGAVGAIHCYRTTGADGNVTQEARFIYDPLAKHGIFRDRDLQGNAFAIRPNLPACIAFHLLQRLGNQQRNAAVQQSLPNEAIRCGIMSGLSLLQTIYVEGFGGTRKDVRDFVENLHDHRVNRLKACVTAASTQLSANIDNKEQQVKFYHIVRPPSSRPDFPQPKWSILHDTLRSMIKPEELRAELAGDSAALEEGELKLRKVEELRRLRMARVIVYFGVTNGLNRSVPHPDSFRKVKSETIYGFLGESLDIESRIDQRFRERSIGIFSTPEIKDRLFPADEKRAFPFNVPVATFGDLNVIGTKDTENFNNIRNLISLHLGRPTGRPLSLVVLGEPGSGKSFGVKAVAKALGEGRLEGYDCNLSQLTRKEELDREFFNVSQILLRDKTPLVFFDEFDCPLNEQKYGWLKFFLEPMQDGKYRHAHGFTELKNAILVFAGGVESKFLNFEKAATDKKEVKGQDFLSRIHAKIEVPSIDRDDDDTIPFVRRALVLRGFIEKGKVLLNSENVAQIDRNVVDAFLRVRRYKHGARSMESILGMCKTWEKGIEKCSVPPKGQLDLHTEGEDFLQLIEKMPSPINRMSATIFDPAGQPSEL